MNTYGINVKLKIYGGSHDERIGMTLDGIPAGEKVDMIALETFMARRAPGKDPYSTKRKEPDKPVFLSGIDENGVTTGKQIEAVIYNTNHHSSDYNALVDIPRRLCGKSEIRRSSRPSRRRTLFGKTHRTHVHRGRHLPANA